MSTRILQTSAALLLAMAASGAQAQYQVYRCGGTHEYTDKPCNQAKPVNLKNKNSNIMVPGPTSVPPPPPPEKPQAAIIWPNASRVVSTPAAPPSNIWAQRDSRQSTPPVSNVGGRAGWP